MRAAAALKTLRGPSHRCPDPLRTRTLLGSSSMASSSVSGSSSPGPMERSIRDKLVAQLNPSTLVITNDSHLHAGHSAMRAIGGGSGETHFSVAIVSDAFRGQRTMQRHRAVYSALGEELKGGLHALVLQTKTPEEVAGGGGGAEPPR